MPVKDDWSVLPHFGHLLCQLLFLRWTKHLASLVVACLSLPRGFHGWGKKVKSGWNTPRSFVKSESWSCSVYWGLSAPLPRYLSHILVPAVNLLELNLQLVYPVIDEYVGVGAPIYSAWFYLYHGLFRQPEMNQIKNFLEKEKPHFWYGWNRWKPHLRVPPIPANSLLFESAAFLRKHCWCHWSRWFHWSTLITLITQVTLIVTLVTLMIITCVFHPTVFRWCTWCPAWSTWSCPSAGRKGLDLHPEKVMETLWTTKI